MWAPAGVLLRPCVLGLKCFLALASGSSAADGHTTPDRPRHDSGSAAPNLRSYTSPRLRQLGARRQAPTDRQDRSSTRPKKLDPIRTAAQHNARPPVTNT